MGAYPLLLLLMLTSAASGHLLPLRKHRLNAEQWERRHSSALARRRLAAAPEPRKVEVLDRIEGGVSSVGQYFTTLSFGGVSMTVQVDTGSSVTAVPAVGCSTCTKGSKRYDLTPRVAAGKAQRIACGRAPCCTTSARCCSRDAKLHGADPANGTCAMSLSYKDKSGATGVLVRDEVAMGKLTFPLVFGAIFGEQGKFEPFAQINGIVGLAGENLGRVPTLLPSFMAQCSAATKIPNKFSMCLGATGGMLAIGDVADKAHKKLFQGAMVSVPYTGDLYYAFPPTDISFVGGKGGKEVFKSYAKEHGGAAPAHAVIDSGSTLVLLQPKLHALWKEAIVAACSASLGRQKVEALLQHWTQGSCTVVPKQTFDCFPSIRISLKGKAETLNVPPSTYVVVVPAKNGGHKFCNGVGKTDNSQNVLGDTFMQSYVVHFDKEARTVGFAAPNPKYCGAAAAGHKAAAVVALADTPWTSADKALLATCAGTLSLAWLLFLVQ